MDGYKTKEQETGLNDNEKDEETRRRTATYFRYAGCVMASAGILSIAMGIPIVILGKDGKWPVISGAPIWCGAVITVFGVFGILNDPSESHWNSEEDEKRQKLKAFRFYIMCAIAPGFSWMCVSYPIQSAIACGQNKLDICGPNFDEVMALNIVATILGFMFIIIAVSVSFMFWGVRRAFRINYCSGSNCN